MPKLEVTLPETKPASGNPWKWIFFGRWSGFLLVAFRPIFTGELLVLGRVKCVVFRRITPPAVKHWKLWLWGYFPKHISRSAFQTKNTPFLFLTLNQLTSFCQKNTSHPHHSHKLTAPHSPPTHSLWRKPTHPTPPAPLRKASICCLTALVLSFKKSFKHSYDFWGWNHSHNPRKGRNSYSKNFPTYPERNIPQTPNQGFMKGFLSFGGLGIHGVCSRGMLGFS